MSHHRFGNGFLDGGEGTVTFSTTENGYVIFTHDLDFGAMLALSRIESPSVLQVRARNVLPDHLGTEVHRQAEVDFGQQLCRNGHRRTVCHLRNALGTDSPIHMKRTDSVRGDNCID